MAREIETKCIHLEEAEGALNHFGAMAYPIYQSAAVEKTIVNEVAHFTPDRWIN